MNPSDFSFFNMRKTLKLDFITLIYYIYLLNHKLIYLLCNLNRLWKFFTLIIIFCYYILLFSFQLHTIILQNANETHTIYIRFLVTTRSCKWNLEIASAYVYYNNIRKSEFTLLIKKKLCTYSPYLSTRQRFATMYELICVFSMDI